MMVGRRQGRLGAKLLVAVGIAAIGLGGCSSVKESGMDPIEWYRDLSGASSHDAMDKEATNSQNLKEGNKEPYPSLAGVPAVPSTAISKADREKLAQNLVADRQNAHYSDQTLRAGQDTPAVPAPAAMQAAATQTAAAPSAAPSAPVRQQALATPAKPAKKKSQAKTKRGSEQPPREASMKSPSLGAMPQGEQARTPPPTPPGVPHREELAAATPPGGGVDRNIVVRAAQINFSPGPFRARLLPSDRKQLMEVARRALANNARIRVVGHGGAAAHGDLSQREFQSFDAALDHAKAVAVALTEMGVPASQIDVETATNVNAPDGADVFLEY